MCVGLNGGSGWCVYRGDEQGSHVFPYYYCVGRTVVATCYICVRLPAVGVCTGATRKGDMSSSSAKGSEREKRVKKRDVCLE